MIDSRQTVRSYQRIFSPERRIHQIEGRPLPVPGGVPLRWLGWAAGSLVCILALGSGSLFIAAVAAAAAGAGGLTIGDRAAGLLAAAAALVGMLALGALVGVLDWPVRLVVVPVAVATLATQATPDGRRPERFAISWLSLRLAPPRRSLGRPCPTPGVPLRPEGEIWVAPDAGGPRLRRGRITGPAAVHLAEPVSVRRRLFGQGLLASRPGRLTPRARLRSTVELGPGDRLEVRP